MKHIELYWYHDGKHDIYITRNRKSIRHYRADKRRMDRIARVLDQMPVRVIRHTLSTYIIEI